MFPRVANSFPEGTCFAHRDSTLQPLFLVFPPRVFGLGKAPRAANPIKEGSARDFVDLIDRSRIDSLQSDLSAHFPGGPESAISRGENGTRT